MEKNKIISKLLAFLLIFITMMGSMYASQSAVDLGTAGNFVVLSKSGISTTGVTSIVGDIGVSPIDSTAITGFGLIVDPSTQYATSSLIDGKVYASDYAAPTPTQMTTAIADMETAYSDATGRTLPDYIELGAGDIGGLTLAPGLYKWGTGVTIPTDVTISGSSTDVWIFQIAQTLDIADGKQIILSGGARAENIFWQVGGQTTIGTTSVFNGVILSKTGIVMNTGSTLNGRALAQTAVTLDSSTISSSKAVEVTSSNDDTSDTSSSDSDSSSSGGSTFGSWDCPTQWSECSSEGISTQTCTKPGAEPMIKTQSCVPTLVQLEDQNDVNDVNDVNENNVEISDKVNEIKENVKSGDFVNSLGEVLKVTELKENLRELRVDDVSAQTELNLTFNTDLEGKTKLKIMLRNGQEREIKIMPNRASEIALDKLGIKVCSIENNCSIELRDVGNGDSEKIQYEMQLEKDSKLFGIFPKKMKVIAIVDAQTGDVKLHKPWWAFLASEN